MDFSPYKPSPDDKRTRQQQKKGKSKLSHSPYASQTTNPNGTSSSSPPSGAKQQQPASPYQVGGGMLDSSLLEEGLLANGSSGNNGAATMRVNKYETTMPIRVDLEAALTYLFPPLSGKGQAIGTPVVFSSFSFSLCHRFALPSGGNSE
jgi:hypothetical protein